MVPSSVGDNWDQHEFALHPDVDVAAQRPRLLLRHVGEVDGGARGKLYGVVRGERLGWRPQASNCWWLSAAAGNTVCAAAGVASTIAAMARVLIFIGLPLGLPVRWRRQVG